MRLQAWQQGPLLPLVVPDFRRLLIGTVLWWQCFHMEMVVLGWLVFDLTNSPWTVTLDSPYGPLDSAWELTADDFRLQITVPPNAHATVRLPAQSLADVSEGGQALQSGKGIGDAQLEGDEAIIAVGSGHYEFVTTGLNLAQAMADVKHVAGRLDRYSSLRDLLADDAAKAVLAEQLGTDFLRAPMLGMVMNSPLVAVAGFASTLLTPERLDVIEAAVIGGR